MKLLTLDELGATNLEGCEALIEQWQDKMAIHHMLADHVRIEHKLWPIDNDRVSMLLARAERFKHGVYSHVIDVQEKNLERFCIDVANRGGDLPNNIGCTQEEYSIYCTRMDNLKSEKEYHRVFHNEFQWNVKDAIAIYYEESYLPEAVNLSEAYDMTIYTCKSCNSWHILNNDADPICPDCEYSLDEVL